MLDYLLSNRPQQFSRAVKTADIRQKLNFVDCIGVKGLVCLLTLPFRLVIFSLFARKHYDKSL